MKVEDLAVKKVLNKMQNVNIVEEKDISSRTVDSISMKEVKMVSQNQKIIKLSTIDFLATTIFFNRFQPI